VLCLSGSSLFLTYSLASLVIMNNWPPFLFPQVLFVWAFPDFIFFLIFLHFPSSGLECFFVPRRGPDTVPSFHNIPIVWRAVSLQGLFLALPFVPGRFQGGKLSFFFLPAPVISSSPILSWTPLLLSPPPAGRAAGSNFSGRVLFLPAPDLFIVGADALTTACLSPTDPHPAGLFRRPFLSNPLFSPSSPPPVFYRTPSSWTPSS